MTVGGKLALIKQRFTYVLRWSDPRTWGVDLPPVDGDLVYIPEGMTLLVDQTWILDKDYKYFIKKANKSSNR